MASRNGANELDEIEMNETEEKVSNILNIVYSRADVPDNDDLNEICDALREHVNSEVKRNFTLPAPLLI